MFVPEGGGLFQTFSFNLLLIDPGIPETKNT